MQFDKPDSIKKDGERIIKIYNVGKKLLKRSDLKCKEYYIGERLERRIFTINEYMYHRLNGPAIKEWYPNGQLKKRIYREYNRLHRINGPAWEEWYENGRLRVREYRQHDQLHNITGPAYIEWYPNGELKSCYYYIDGKKHRSDGPAEEHWLENGELLYREYFVNDRSIKIEFGQIQSQYMSSLDKSLERCFMNKDAYYQECENYYLQTCN